MKIGVCLSGHYRNFDYNYDSIEDCINWDKKLESVGITNLICDETSEKVDVKKIRNEWYEEYKDLLV